MKRKGLFLLLLFWGVLRVYFESQFQVSGPNHLAPLFEACEEAAIVVGSM
jgi:hypothetical protein